MEEFYNLRRHTHLAVFHLGKSGVEINIRSRSVRLLDWQYGSSRKEDCITYDKKKTNILSWGDKNFESHNQDDIRIDDFRDKLYQLFKKDKEQWNQDDLFLIQAVSDYMRLLVEERIEELKDEKMLAEQSSDLEWLHYVFIVPSEWEEEIRESLLRPLFIKSGLISEDDHKDRLFFRSDLDSIFCNLTNRLSDHFGKGKNTILCRFIPVKVNEMLIKSSIVSPGNYTSNFSGILSPKVARSNAITLTTNDIIDSIRAFIGTKIPIDVHEKVIQAIMDKEEEEENNDDDEDFEDYLFWGYKHVEDEYEDNEIRRPFIKDASEWGLDKHQTDFIESICAFNICANMRNTFNNVNDLISNNPIKKYIIVTVADAYSSGFDIDKSLLEWSEHMLEYNRISCSTENVEQDPGCYNLICHDILMGAFRYGFGAIRNSDIKGKPHILSVEDSTISPSIFIKSKPNAIMNIDMSLKSTLLSFSLLDENGLVKEIWNHDYFVSGTSLCSLGSFFNFSEGVTLNVKQSFMQFAKDYLMDDTEIRCSYRNDILNSDTTEKIEAILCRDSINEDSFVSIQENIVIKAFILLYMIHVNSIISSKLSTITEHNQGLKIGYSITVEKILLDRVFCTEEYMKDTIYASGLIQKDDLSKKLRIITRGERLLPLIQQSLSLPFPLKSFFVLAQLNEDYIQLTLNQVVTESNSKKENQESIIIRDKIIQIPNIYDSLCLSMWNNIVKDSSLIQLCDAHKMEDALPSLFSLKNQDTFKSNLKQYISKNNVVHNSTEHFIEGTVAISLDVSCNCVVSLTASNIAEISFQPVLQNIISLIATSLTNEEFFKNFRNIKYLFQLIHFDYNTQLYDAIFRILEETAEYIKIEHKIETPYYVLPRLTDQLLQPIRHQQPFLYKEFQVGALNQVWSDHYGFNFTTVEGEQLIYKSEISDTEPVLVNQETMISLLKKGDRINGCQTKKIFYLHQSADNSVIGISFFKLKTLDGLRPNGTVYIENILEKLCWLWTVRRSPIPQQGLPFAIYAAYDAYLSSFTFTINIVGEEILTMHSVVFAEPMTLRRF